jgi:uncharacterized membrane protein YeaQ/YmgE (transglycosylase-associated protein family)
MDTTTLLMSQLTDIFRIGLLAGLILTMERTRAQTGVVLPIVAGIVFIAVIIPATLPRADVPMMQAIISGLVANSIITAVLWTAWSFLRPRQQ